ncbi:MAG: L-histidine N(alpha)-methyltransferase [Alphaproteobacteria bacterium]
MLNPVDLELLRDAQDLFARRRDAHMGAHLYADHGGRNGNPSKTGAKLWKSLAEEEPAYYISRDDNRLLAESLSSLSKAIPPHLTLRDIGPGADESVIRKTVSLVKALQPSLYTAVDVEPSFAQAACELVKQAIPGVSARPEVANALQGDQNSSEPAVTYFGGSTVGNIVHGLDAQFPVTKLAGMLHGLAPHDDNYLILSFDANRDPASLLKAYASEGSVEFCTNALHRIARELPHQGFDAENFSYRPFWNAQGGQIAHLWQVRRDMDFTLGGEHFSLKAGEEFHGLNSYKPSEGNIAKAAKLAGLEVLQFFRNDSTLRLGVLHRPAATTSLPKLAVG